MRTTYVFGFLLITLAGATFAAVVLDPHERFDAEYDLVRGVVATTPVMLVFAFLIAASLGDGPTPLTRREYFCTSVMQLLLPVVASWAGHGAFFNMVEYACIIVMLSIVSVASFRILRHNLNSVASWIIVIGVAVGAIFGISHHVFQAPRYNVAIGLPGLAMVLAPLFTLIELAILYFSPDMLVPETARNHSVLSHAESPEKIVDE